MITIEEVLTAENIWTQAHQITDNTTLDKLIHPEYSIIKPDGSVWDKEKSLASYIPGKRE